MAITFLPISAGDIGAGAVGTTQIADKAVTTAKIADAAVGPSQEDIATVTALADADAVLTAAQLLGGMFTITPGAARALTTDTAANIVAAIPDAQVGTQFRFTVQVLAAFACTIGGGAGVTTSGNMAPNNVSASFLVVLDDVTAGSEAATVYALDE